MKTYQIEVTEKLQRIIKIKAISEKEALHLVDEKYKNENIVLDSSDYISKEIKLYNDSNSKENLEVLINKVIGYLWKDEEKHFYELGQPNNHIYLVLKELKKLT